MGGGGEVGGERGAGEHHQIVQGCMDPLDRMCAV